MKILITGNMGYVGPSVVRQLRDTYPQATLVGYDMGYFAQYLTHTRFLPECEVDMQIFGDVRRFEATLLDGVDAVVYLAALSNDPMGKSFEDVTLDVNRHAAIAMARAARQAGVRRFVFASSCSVYGAAEEGARTETSAVNPLTAYARSKVYAEEDLRALAQDSFVVTALRFATACGMSERLRLDLVVNDFVAAAVASGQITILSDGTPWRPLIHVKDMARAIDWAVARPATQGGGFLSVNVGREDWNHQVRDLAAAVAKVIPGTTVSINTDAQPDKRSYRVDFSLFRQLAPDHQPVYDLTTTVREMHTALVDMRFDDVDFRNSRLVRLHALNHLVESGALTPDLRWKPQPLKLPACADRVD